MYNDDRVFVTSARGGIEKYESFVAETSVGERRTNASAVLANIR